MRNPVLLLLAAVALCLGGPAACDRPSSATHKDTAAQPRPAGQTDGDERVAARPRPVRDPVQEGIYAYLLQVRQAYNERRFDELETLAAQARSSRTLFGNGSWKIMQFYEALDCREDEPENMWQLYEQIHQAWIDAKPESLGARIAHAAFLAEYAWHARGNGYANTVTPEGWRLFGERLTAAQTILLAARDLPEKDPMWWTVALRVAQGAGYPKDAYDKLVAEATALEPKFWRYDTARAISLLPRWYGQEGDWEAYADAAARRPGGLGAEGYARVVVRLSGYYDNVFRETQASWLQTREGLALMRKEYPDSLEILSYSAKMATLAESRDLAKELFDRLGDRYLANVWYKPEHFTRAQHWAQTGRW